MTLHEFTAKLNPGINLGNTLENIIRMDTGNMDKLRRIVTFNEDNTKVNIRFEDYSIFKDGKPKVTEFSAYEQLAKTPEITKENIEYIASLGFKSVRLPVCMSYHYNWDTKTYDEYWIKHVKDVVDWIIQSGMICILSLFHEQEVNTEVSVANWQNLDSNPNMERINRAWAKLSDVFKDYSNDTLAFELINEMRLHNYYDTIVNYDYLISVAVDIYHRAFKTVRESGGNNATRILGVYGYTVDYQMLVEKFAPYMNDAFDENTYLTTFVFDDVGFTLCCNEEKTPKTWGSDADKKVLDNVFEYMVKAQETIGRPIVISEYGTESYINCAEKAFLTDAQVQEYRKSCIENIGYTKMLADKYNIPLFLWDTNYYIDRKMNMVDPLIHEAMFNYKSLST